MKPYVVTPARMEGFKIHEGVTDKLVAQGENMASMLTI